MSADPVADYMNDLLDRAALEDERYDEARQRDDDEREMRLHEALDACKEAGVSEEYLKVLAMETGAISWAIKVSLKGY